MAKLTFTDLIQDIANTKKRRSESCFIKQEKNEKPRDVYLSVCKNIADYYEPYGFKYSASRQHLTLKTKGSEFIYKISFSSSHYNIADENVTITVYANVLSHKFKKRQHESKIERCNQMPSEYIGGGLIGNLQDNCSYLRWNVADPSIRHQEINNIIKSINKLAIPFFNLFTNINLLINNIQKIGKFYGMGDICTLTKFLLYSSSKTTVEKTLSNFLTSKKMWNKYLEALEELKIKGQLYGGEYRNTIAKLTKELDLNLINKQ